MPLHYRQGDLLFVLQDARPAAELTALRSNVIVVGEATGHAHRLAAGTVLEAPDGTLYLELPVAAEVVHEEHQPITLEAGLWLVVRQREYSPEAIRLVRD